MSYNESLSPNSNYPAMSQSQWDNAPFNEIPIPERDFEVRVTQVLVKEDTISTDQYVPEYDDEDGRTYANTDDTDWNDVYKEVACTPDMLIAVCKKLAQHLVDKGIKRVDGTWLPSIIKECDGWEVDETTVDKI